MAARFATGFIFLLLALHMCDNFLFSRFRNPNEFVAPLDVMGLEDLDPDTYENLLEEVPDLRGHMKRQRSREPLRMPYLKNNFVQSDEYDFMINGADLEDGVTVAPPPPPLTSMGKEGALNATLNVSLPGPGHNASDSSNRRQWWPFDYYWTGPKVATCYVCNVYRAGLQDNIPVSPACHDAFESQNWRARTLARYFRAHCYKNHHFWGSRIEPKRVFSRYHEYDRGLIRGFYGPYIGGCFKRFLDVGAVYTSRGCRSMLPKLSYGAGFADHRYRKLELVLWGQKDVCVMSPHASLTPFSRAISLYVRYHVCVCTSRYCNSAATFAPLAISAHLLLYIFLL